MPGDSRPLIVGGGPTGLAAALFLSHRGVPSRIIDAALKPPVTSRALAVNPRSLSILAGTGVDAEILSEGRPIDVLRVHQDGREQAKIEIDLRGLGVASPLIALPQARTEALLAEALAARGVTVERGIGLAALSQDADGVTATLTNGATAAAPIRLGLSRNLADHGCRDRRPGHGPGPSFDHSVPLRVCTQSLSALIETPCPPPIPSTCPTPC